MLENSVTTSWVDGFSKTHSGIVDQTVEGFSVIDCECCGFRHVVPLPTSKELETIYSHDYYSREKPLYIERYIEDKEWWDAIYSERYDVLERYLGGNIGSILDVGSGPGLFLSLGRTRGWRVRGIEPSHKAAEYSRKVLDLDIEEIFLGPDTAPKLGQYDVVSMGEVLEHLPNPLEMLHTARGLIKKDGLLTLVVPNDFNPFQVILRDHMDFSPWWVAPPHHLNYFTHDSLRRLVELAGFEILQIDSTFPIDIFLMMGKNYIGNDVLGREMHQLRKTFDLNLLNGVSHDLRTKLYSAFADLGLGREIVLYARRIN
jgi:SAM-dependent methyltransferase